MYKSRSLLSLEVPLGHFFDCFLPWSQILFQGILTFFFKSVSVINWKAIINWRKKLLRIKIWMFKVLESYTNLQNLRLVLSKLQQALKFEPILAITDKTRSSWLNCALLDVEVMYWVSRGHLCLYMLKMEIWSGDTDAWHWLTRWLTDFER